MLRPSILVTACLLAPFATGQVLQPVLRSGDPVPGNPGQQITDMSGPLLSEDGQSGVWLHSSSFTSSQDHIWVGRGGSGTVVREPGTVAGLEQTFFPSNFGVSAAGNVFYESGLINPMPGGGFLEGLFRDDTVFRLTGTPIASVPGLVWKLLARPREAANGTLAWLSDLEDTQLVYQGRGIFIERNGVEQVLARTGDVIAGLTPLQSNLLHGDFNISNDGSAWIAVLDASNISLDDATVMIGDVDAGTVAPVMVGGGMWKENEPMTALQGGAPGELWDDFTYVDVNNAGSWLAAGDTSAPSAQNHFLAVDGVIRYREGDVVDGGTLLGPCLFATLGEDGRVGYIWYVDDPNGAVEALFLDDRMLLKEGDSVDWDYSGTADSFETIDGFGGFDGELALGPGGTVAFVALVDSQNSYGPAFFVWQRGEFWADDYNLSLSAGGTQALSLDAGPSHAGELYFVVGSLSGTAPGFPYQGLLLPLVVDSYFLSTLRQPNSGALVNTLGFLDANGRANASIVLPPGLPVPAGTVVHHAYMTASLAPLTATSVSAPVPVLLVP